MNIETAFVRKILDNMAEFTGKEDTDRREEFLQIIHNFPIADLEDAGLKKISLDPVLEEAKNLLKDFRVELPRPSYCSRLALKELGRKKQNKKSATEDSSLQKAALHMAHVLAAYEEDVMLTVTGRVSADQQMKTDFVLSSCEMKDDVIQSMIRSVYGQVRTVPAGEFPLYPCRAYACGRMIYPGKDRKKEQPDFKKLESWTTAILKALPASGDFTVSIRLCPLSAAGIYEVEKQREKLARCYNKLKFYSELTCNYSSVLGSSRNPKDNILREGKDTVFGKNQAGENHSFSIAVSGRDTDRNAWNMLEPLEYEMRRLQNSLDTSAWGIQISAAARSEETLQSLTSVLSGTLEYGGLRLFWSDKEPDRIGFVMNQEEVLPLLFFPAEEFCGFAFKENEEFSLVSENIRGEGFQVGNLLHNSLQIAPFYLSADALSRHAFICGMTGGGKTNTMFHLIRGASLPFCVIEPVKGEYRALKSIFPDLKVLTMKTDAETDGMVDIMQINPFWFPQGASLSYHIDSIRTIIASAFELTEAMPNILEQCLYNIYIDSGWDIVRNVNIYRDSLPEEYLYPTFTDLCSEIEDYLERSDYSEEVKGNYKGALLSRIRSFANGYKGVLLNTTAHPDYEALMTDHCVVELEGLADDADKCLVMGTILTQYYQYRKNHFPDSGEKKKAEHLIVIEEAHRLFKNSKKNEKSGGPDPTGQLVELLSNMMAEIRAFGEGMLIVDQSPTKLAEDVIKNSATKIVHRIDNSNDIKVMQSCMLLPDDLLSFASLRQGEALVRTDYMTKPCKVKILLSDVKEEYSLAATFRNGDAPDNRLSDSFFANSVLNDANIYKEVSRHMQAYLNSLAVTECAGWREQTGEFIYDLTVILKKWNRYDGVDRFSVLFETALLAVKRMYFEKSKREMGMIHMFLNRMFTLYYEQKDGSFVKKGETVLFRKYMDKNMKDILKKDNLSRGRSGRYEELCLAIGLEAQDFMGSVLCRFVYDIWDEVRALGREEAVSDQMLSSAFFKNYVMEGAESILEDRCPDIFRNLKEYLCRKIFREKVDDF